MNLWQARIESLEYLAMKQPSRLAVMDRSFELFDSCIEAFELAPDSTPYARVCAVATLKAKNLALGSYSLVLDGLAQESGALLRPMIEYAELLTYLRLKPEMAERALNNNLPKAGERAKAIQGIYRSFREYLNEHASHSSFSDEAVKHLIDSQEMRLRKLQPMHPDVLDWNLVDLVVHIHLTLHEAVLSLEPTGSPHFERLGESWERLKARMFDVFELDSRRKQK